MIPSPPISTRNDTLLPYTTHFRSVSVGRGASILGLSTAWLEWLVLGAGHELMLFASVGILLIGLDDLLFDALWLATRRRDPAPIPSAPPIDGRFAVFVPAWDERSEEHTSELQSLMRISYAVFCLKKKKD